MAIWRSPLLYLGFAIILLVAAALAAPHVVDFNRFKPQMEAWGARLTGRKVHIGGDVQVSLFPWPTLRLRNVSVSNPPGARQPQFLTAEEISTRLSLAALLSGELEIEQVHFTRPILALERLTNGSGTWRITPRSGLHLPFSPQRIAIAGITIEDGTLVLADDRRDGQARLKHIKARISAPALPGPWRLTGTAARARSKIRFTFATGKRRKGQPLRISARIAPVDQAGFLYTFDGKLGAPQPGRISGQLRIRPVDAKGKQSPPSGLSLFSFKAAIEAGFDDIWLKKMEAAPISAAHSANTITGTAHIVLGEILEVETALKASRFDLDYALGADARSRLFGPQGLRQLSALVQALPESVLLRLDVHVPSLLAGGQTLENLRMSLDASSAQLAINSFSTRLPGQTSLAFHGQFVPAGDAPDLSGQAQFSSASLRDFFLWAIPRRADDISRVWSGARGKLTLNAQVDITPQNLRIEGGAFVLDDEKGRITASLGASPEGLTRLELNINAGKLDVDRYAPSGLAAADGASDPATAFFGLLAAAMQSGETDIALSAAQLHVWGLPMRDVAIQVIANPDLVEIRNFDIGSLKGAKIDMAGLLKFPDDSIEGSMDAHITSPDGRPLWRLLSGMEKRPDPAWLKDIGKIDLRLRASARALDKGAHVSASVKGAAGPASVDGSADFTGLPAQWRKAAITLRANVTSPASAPLLALAGVRGGRARDTPASFRLTARGRPAKGLQSTLTLDIAGIESRFLGQLRNLQPQSGWTGEGTFALRATRASALLRMAGLAIAQTPPVSLYGEGKLAFSPGHAGYDGIKGRFGEVPFSAALKLNWQDGQPAISGRIGSARLHLPALAHVWLTAPRQTNETLAAQADDATQALLGPSRFRAGLFASPSLDLQWRAGKLTVLPGLTLDKASLDITQNRKSLKAVIKAGKPDSAQVETTLSITPARGGLAFAAESQGRLPLQSYLKDIHGAPVIKAPASFIATWKSRARSLAGLATAMNGSGLLRVEKGLLLGANPAAYLTAVMKAKSPAEAEEMAREILDKGTMPLPAAERKFAISSGLLAVEPLDFTAGDIGVRLKTLLSVPQQKLDLSLRFAGKGPVPPFRLVFSGPPGALERIHDLAELKNWVSVTALRRSMENLERIERKRRRILQEESAFERGQVMYDRWRQWDKARQVHRRRMENLLMRQERQKHRRALREWRKRLKEQKRKAEEQAILRQKEQAAQRAAEIARKRKEVLARRREDLRRKTEAALKALGQAKPKAQPAPAETPRPTAPATTERQTAPPIPKARPADAARTVQRKPLPPLAVEPAPLPGIIRNLRTPPAPIRLLPRPKSPPRVRTNFTSGR